MPAFLSRAWQAWKRAAFWLGEKQAGLVYAIIYYVVIGPIALARRPFVDPLQFRARARASFWIPRAATPATLEEARRQ
jgi:hypothetical protein